MSETVAPCLQNDAHKIGAIVPCNTKRKFRNWYKRGNGVREICRSCHVLRPLFLRPLSPAVLRTISGTLASQGLTNIISRNLSAFWRLIERYWVHLSTSTKYIWDAYNHPAKRLLWRRHKTTRAKRSGSFWHFHLFFRLWHQISLATSSRVVLSS